MALHHIKLIDADGNVIGALGQLTPTTIATLPASPVLGRIACVTDGDGALAWGATVVNSGAGATKYLVWYNGAAWKVFAK
jgi:hypothetical protein